MGLHLHIDCDRDEIIKLLEKIVATQAELVTALNTLNDKIAKIGTETTALLAAVTDLQAQLADAPVSPELQAAFDRVAVQAGIVDDLVPDPAPPMPPP